MRTGWLTFHDRKWLTLKRPLTKAPDYIKKVIGHKKREGSSRRFQAWYFGEAVVAVNKASETRHGWFNSFHWLVEKRWGETGYNPEDSDDPMESHFKPMFHQALEDFIHFDKVKQLQEQSKIILNKFAGDLQKTAPKAPDLWLIGRDGVHSFIEVKLQPNDKAQPHQLAGLAILRKVLKASVKVVRLYDLKKERPEPNDYTEEFYKYYDFSTR